MNCILGNLYNKGFISINTHYALFKDICENNNCDKCPLLTEFGVIKNLENAPYTEEYLSKQQENGD